MARRMLPGTRAWPRAEQGRRQRLAAGMLAAVLLAHAWLLGSVRPPGMPGRAATSPADRALQVRLIEPEPERAAPVAAAAAVPTEAAARPERRPPRHRREMARTLPAPIPPSPSPAQTAPMPAPAGAPEDAGRPPPRYATRLPASQVLHYTLERGAQQGAATLRWQLHDDGRYALQLDGDFGRDRAGRSSRGALDADGLAPGRYVETRRGREQRAVNFQRDKALITYSASVRSHALWPAAQDRLSWIVHLAAVLQADATLHEPGRSVLLFVAGPRGEAETWDFQVLGAVPLALPTGPLSRSLHLRREPARPWEPQIDLWLDPQRQHLPVRLRWLVRPTGEATELLLRAEPAS